MGMYVSTTGKILAATLAASVAAATLGGSTNDEPSGSFFFNRYMIGCYIAGPLSYFTNDHSWWWTALFTPMSWLYIGVKILLHFFG